MFLWNERQKQDHGNNSMECTFRIETGALGFGAELTKFIRRPMNPTPFFQLFKNIVLKLFLPRATGDAALVETFPRATGVAIPVESPRPRDRNILVSVKTSPWATGVAVSVESPQPCDCFLTPQPSGIALATRLDCFGVSVERPSVIDLSTWLDR